MIMSAGFHVYDDIQFKTRVEAEDAIAQLREMIRLYGTASLADLYDLADKDYPQTHKTRIWTNLVTAEVVRMRNGYTLNLPLTADIKSYKDYCRADVASIKSMLNSVYGATGQFRPQIKNVIFNDPATIVFWTDGSKTVVKCQEGDFYDHEKGLAMAISKKILGNNYSYYNTFKKWLKKAPKQEVSTND